MDAKKSNRADLNSKKVLFFEIGMAVALGFALVAFEYSTGDRTFSIAEITSGDIDPADLPPVTVQTEEPEQEVAKPVIHLADAIEIVDNNSQELIDMDIFNTEYDPSASIESYSAPIIEEPEDDEVILFPAKMPQFPGGEKALIAYLSKTVKYPAICIDNGIQGRVFVRFVIDKNGNVCDVEVPRHLDPNLDKEAMRVVQSMPQWEPGENNGRRVKVAYTLPVNFQLKN